MRAKDIKKIAKEKNRLEYWKLFFLNLMPYFAYILLYLIFITVFILLAFSLALLSDGGIYLTRNALIGGSFALMFLFLFIVCLSISFSLVHIGTKGVILSFVRDEHKKTLTLLSELAKKLSTPYWQGILLTVLLKGVLIFAWSLPVLLVIAFIRLIFGDFHWLQIFTIIIPIYKGIQYSQSSFAVFDEIKRTGKLSNATIALTRSKLLMRGHFGDYIRLELSFIGWYALSFLTCGLGLLFLAPYRTTALAIFYDELERKQTQDESKLLTKEGKMVKHIEEIVKETIHDNLAIGEEKPKKKMPRHAPKRRRRNPRTSH